ncbi:MAG: NnrU family protein [Kiloniellales bacterium]|nr:NnrU family protein [Kiloniellales bacterium]
MDVAIAMGVFLLSHVAIARTGVRPFLIERLGRRGYLTAYSALSVALLAWVIVALLESPRVWLWPSPGWAYPFALIVSAVAFALIGIGAVVRNPLSVAFRAEGFDPDRPGIVGWVRHPLIWGLGLWGLAHIPANGDWPGLLLFAGSALFALIGARAVERRKKMRLGAAKWRRLTSGPGGLDRPALLGAGLGFALWAAALALHPVLFGVDPWGLTRALLFSEAGG